VAGAVAAARATTGPSPTELGSRPDRAAGERGGGDVLAVGVLWSRRWTGQALAALAGDLGEGGSLVMVEPVAALGWRRLVQWLLTPWWRWRLRHDFNRDLLADLRAAGFVPTDIDRFADGPLGVRTYVSARAVPAKAVPAKP
jgi:hypothetical protein